MNGRRCTVVIHPGEPGRDARASRRSAPRRGGDGSSALGGVLWNEPRVAVFIANRRGEGNRTPVDERGSRSVATPGVGKLVSVAPSDPPRRGRKMQAAAPSEPPVGGQPT